VESLRHDFLNSPTTCVATQVILIFDVFPGTLLSSNPHFRGEKRNFDGTVDPVVAGSSPVALALRKPLKIAPCTDFSGVFVCALTVIWNSWADCDSL
jgi:hypothetical protein